MYQKIQTEYESSQTEEAKMNFFKMRATPGETNRILFFKTENRCEPGNS